MRIRNTIIEKEGYEFITMEADDGSQMIPPSLNADAGVPGYSGAGDARSQALISGPDPHLHLISSICDDVLPNIVSVYDSGRLSSALNRDHFERIIEQKVELAKRFIRLLPADDQEMYRARIAQAYAESIDRLYAIPGNQT